MSFSLILAMLCPPCWLHFLVYISFKNAFQTRSISASILECISAPFWLPFGSPNRSQNESRPPLGHKRPPEACPGTLQCNPGAPRRPGPPREVGVYPSVCPGPGSPVIYIYICIYIHVYTYICIYICIYI